MSPAKIAMAVAVTMAAIAGTGGMKKVTGTSSAVAMVAVRPGMAPTNRPKSGRAQDDHEDVGVEDEREGLASRRIIRNTTRLSTPHGRGTRSNL